VAQELIFLKILKGKAIPGQAFSIFQDNLLKLVVMSALRTDRL
jgi:hypothetical protein